MKCKSGFPERSNLILSAILRGMCCYHLYFSDKEMDIQRSELTSSGDVASECDLGFKFRSAVWALNHYHPPPS